MKHLRIISVLFLSIFFLTAPARAQFSTVYVGVNGLTCSQCSRTVEVSLRNLDFVADVQMNLEHTEGKIILKTGKKADIDKVAQAVVDAGFSVRYLSADFAVDNLIANTGPCFKYKGDEYVFTEAPKEPLKGTVRLKFIGKKYLPKSEFKKMQTYMAQKCDKSSGKVYHVAI